MQARVVCSSVKPRIRELASKEGLVGLLAVQVLLALYDENERCRSRFLDNRLLLLTNVLAQQLDMRNARVRANLASTLVRLNFGRQDSADGQGYSIDPGQQILRQVYGLGE